MVKDSAVKGFVRIGSQKMNGSLNIVKQTHLNPQMMTMTILMTELLGVIFSHPSVAMVGAL